MVFDESTQKAVLALTSVVVGWFLGQGTTLIQKWWNNKRLKKALLTELEDLKKRLFLTCRTYERKLQIYSLKMIEPSMPLKLTHLIYTKYYPDIFFKLNHAQRHSYELIHSQVEATSQGIDYLTEVTLQAAKALDEKHFEQWGDAIKGQYEYARLLYWHITFHLDNPENPDLGDLYSPQHKVYLKECDQIQETIEIIIEKAKSLNKEDFKKNVIDDSGSTLKK